MVSSAKNNLLFLIVNIEEAIEKPAFSSPVIKSSSCCRKDFSGNCGIQMQTRELNDLPQKKPDCSRDLKTSSGK